MMNPEKRVIFRKFEATSIAICVVENLFHHHAPKSDEWPHHITHNSKRPKEIGLEISGYWHKYLDEL